MDSSNNFGGNPLITQKRKLNEEEFSSKRKKHKKVHKWTKKKGFGAAANRRLNRSKHLKHTLRAKPEAPFNSTQFLMEEHDRLNDHDLDIRTPKRHRDSSFSMDSDDLEDVYMYSSEEDDYMARDFRSAYDDYQAERLDSMSKAQLIQEHFLLEERVSLLQRELDDTRQRDRTRTRSPSPADGEEGEEMVPGEIRVDAETAAKIEIFTTEIKKLEEENNSLKVENRSLKTRCKRHSSSSSSSGGDTVNSSSDSSSSTSSDSEGEVEGRSIADRLSPLPATTEVNKRRESSVDGASDSGVASCEGGTSGLEDGCASTSYEHKSEESRTNSKNRTEMLSEDRLGDSVREERDTVSLKPDPGVDEEDVGIISDAQDTGQTCDIDAT